MWASCELCTHRQLRINTRRTDSSRSTATKSTRTSCQTQKMQLFLPSSFNFHDFFPELLQQRPCCILVLLWVHPTPSPQLSFYEVMVHILPQCSAKAACGNFTACLVYSGFPLKVAPSVWRFRCTKLVVLGHMGTAGDRGLQIRGGSLSVE